MPIIEIALFIMLGNVIGLWPTLLGVLLTALIGSFIIRNQGSALFANIQQTTAKGQLPAKQLAEAMMIGISGALLLTPGYFTDLIGFLLLVPALRTIIYNELKSRISVVSASSFSSQYSSNPFEQEDVASLDDEEDIIDLDEKSYRPKDYPNE